MGREKERGWKTNQQTQLKRQSGGFALYLRGAMYFLGMGAMTAVGATELAGPGLELPLPVPMEPGEGLCSTPAGEEEAEETSIFF